jgi:hypothetical protein
MLAMSNSVRRIQLKAASMKTRRSIRDLFAGETAQISAFDDEKTARLAMCMGLRVGGDVKCVHKFGTDIIASNGSTIAIDKEIGGKIYVL